MGYTKKISDVMKYNVSSDKPRCKMCDKELSYTEAIYKQYCFNCQKRINEDNSLHLRQVQPPEA